MGELIFNILLLAFFVVMFINGTTIETWGEHASAMYWPQTILALLIVLLAVNIVTAYRKIPVEERGLQLKSFTFKVPGVEKLLTAFGLLAAYAILLAYGGFIVTSFVFCVCFSRLLGEKRISRLIIFSASAVLILYGIFLYGLEILLPRGVGFFRTFSLMAESLL